VIGLGYPEAIIETIFPQPHDIPMQWIVTGGKVPRYRDRAL
jgi:5-formyltetrahydrofolate cyclo-ligase